MLTVFIDLVLYCLNPFGGSNRVITSFIILWAFLDSFVLRHQLALPSYRSYIPPRISGMSNRETNTYLSLHCGENGWFHGSDIRLMARKAGSWTTASDSESSQNRLWLSMNRPFSLWAGLSIHATWRIWNKLNQWWMCLLTSPSCV